jgi:hypothetical protein
MSARGGDSIEAAMARGGHQRILARAVPLAAVSVGAAGLAMGLGAPAWVLLAPLLILPALRAPDPRTTAHHWDAAARLDGALECAWDHRASAEPIPRAQRAQALRALAASGPARAAPRPSPVWALALLGLAWPALQPPAAPIDPPAAPLSAGVETVASQPGSAPASGALENPDAPDAGGARAQTNAAKPDAGAPGDPSQPGGALAGSAQAGGVGHEAGDRSGGAAGRAKAAGGAEAGGDVAIAQAGGIRRTTPRGRLLIAPSLTGGAPLDDDIADPARPYPPRYHRVVSRWFARGSHR